ncbi:MAG TPA: tail fiber domain-containing protein, partial [Chitinophagaceae bacterium]|nr:tail fiber domain-containing protein [Chitinophagaceae bacterium]
MGEGGYFSGGYLGLDAVGGQIGGRFNASFKGIEVNLQTTTNNGGWPQYGIYVEAKNPAVTDHIYGVYSYVEGNNAAGNVIGVYSKPKGPGGFVTSFYGEGNVNITGSYYSSSDAKLKQNIKPMQSMLDKIMQLSPSTYEYRTEEYKMNLPKGNQFGLIAQDVQKVFPELVANQVRPAEYDQKTKEKLSDEVKYLGVNYTGLIPIIISGMQDLKR